MASLADLRVQEALAALASRKKAPAAGVAAALAGAAAASLVELTAGLAAERFAAERDGARAEAATRLRALAERAGELRERLLVVADDDALAYAQVIEAGEGAALAKALSRASEPPLAIAEGAGEVAEAAAETARAGSWAFRADAVVAGELALAAARGGAELVTVNLAGRGDDPRIARAQAAVRRAEDARTGAGWEL